ncbi:hypothetical protein SDC9_86615 [bioreactor metagenome]|uniref:Uncharacterized protein n=1 Tax=bioreactor metagenome TaxID=1076179 RepID=A0A644ZI24_9ZZZZ
MSIQVQRDLYILRKLYCLRVAAQNDIFGQDVIPRLIKQLSNINLTDFCRCCRHRHRRGGQHHQQHKKNYSVLSQFTHYHPSPFFVPLLPLIHSYEVRVIKNILLSFPPLLR